MFVCVPGQVVAGLTRRWAASQGCQSCSQPPILQIPRSSATSSVAHHSVFVSYRVRDARRSFQWIIYGQFYLYLFLCFLSFYFFFIQILATIFPKTLINSPGFTTSRSTTISTFLLPATWRNKIYPVPVIHSILYLQCNTVLWSQSNFDPAPVPATGSGSQHFCNTKLSKMCSFEI